MRTKVISISLLCITRWKIKSQLQSSLTCLLLPFTPVTGQECVLYTCIYISTLHQGHSANSSHNCITTVTWLSRGKLYTCGNSRMFFFSYALHSTCGDIRERKNHGVPIHFVSDTSGKHLNYNITKALSTARSQFSITQTFTLKLVCLIKITNILQ